MSARNLHRFKRGFTSGEMSPYLECRIEFDKMANGCRVLYNMICLPQGAAVRRSGFRFVYDISSLGQDPNKLDVRLIPFIFSRTDAFMLVFFYHDTGVPRMVIAHNNGGLITYPDPPPTECPPGSVISPPPISGDILYLDMPAGLDIKTMDYAQSADEIYICQQAVPQFIIVRHNYYCWTREAMTFASPPAAWLPGNYPETVTFHQQRLVYGGNQTARQTIWASEAGNFLDFDISDPDNVAGSVHFTLDSGTQNNIRWLSSGKALFVGTQAGEWSVTGNNQAALTPSNILAQRQTNSGSESIKPLTIGFSTLYVERHGRAVNEFSYDYNYDGYKSSDVSILASHMTESSSIVDWTFQQVPHRVIWCTLDDGSFIGCTFQREQKVVGWHRHNTDGLVKSVASIPGRTREDDLWMAVERQIVSPSGETFSRTYLELMDDWFRGTDLMKANFLDSFGIYESDKVPTDTVIGLEHLEGRVVGVLADGSVHPPVTVINGSIQLNNEYYRIVVGLSYSSEGRPYPADLELADGTSFGRTQRSTHLDIFFHQTLGGYIGRADSIEGEKFDLVPFRRPSDYTGQAVPVFSGVKHVSYIEGFDRKTEYFIRQNDPLPMTILGIVDTVGVFK